VEKLCDFLLMTVPSGNGDPLGDLGLIVHCFDIDGMPVEGIPPDAFSIVVLEGQMMDWGIGDLPEFPTDELGRVFLTADLPASATIVHGLIGILVTIGGDPVLLDNWGEGIPVEMRTTDLDHDGFAGLSDMVLFHTAYGCCDPEIWCQQADYTGDGCVTLADAAIFEYFWYRGEPGKAARPFPAAHATPAANDVRDLFIGCLQRDFEEDNNGPGIIRDTRDVIAGVPFELKIIAKDFQCLTGVEFDLLLPPFIVNATVLPEAPFSTPQWSYLPDENRLQFYATTSYTNDSPTFVCNILLTSVFTGTLITDLFEFEQPLLTDCGYPPAEREPCIGSPTPCEVSHVTQDDPVFISCPNGDLDISDTVTVVMLDQESNPQPGLLAVDFRTTLVDLRGSNEGNMYKLTALAPETDINGELPYRFEARVPCGWDGCFDLMMTFTYEGCVLTQTKRVRTVNILRYADGDRNGWFDLVSDDDLFAWYDAKFTLDECLDLFGRFRCPVVDMNSIQLAEAHHGHACDMTGVPPSPDPAGVALHQNVPNPFNPTTSFTVELPGDAELASLCVYDLRGRVVRHIWEGPLPLGASRFDWNGRDDGNRTVAAGVYVARIDALGEQSSIRMVLLK